MISVDAALDALDDIYAAAEGAQAWDVALQKLADLLNYQQGNIEFHDVRQGGLRHMEVVNIDPADIAIYGRDFARDNPRVNHLRGARTALSFDHLFLSEAEMDRDPFYAEFLAPRNLRYFVSSNSDVFDGNMQAVLALQRDARLREADEEGIRVMAHLRPHLNRALKMTWSRLKSELSADRFGVALQSFGLTAAETRLATALAHGDGLRDYAARKGLSINTVYTHYARVKAKLDCADQASLARRLEALKRGALS